jgi:hypothetical protein
VAAKRKKAAKVGGAREGSGRPAFFRGRQGEMDSTTIRTTATAATLVDDVRATLARELAKMSDDEVRRICGWPKDQAVPKEIGRSTLFEILIRKSAQTIKLADVLALEARYQRNG